MKKFIKTLKKYFVPHEENDHKPHFLRPQTVLFVCMVALVAESVFLFGSSYVIPRSRLFGVILVNALVDGTNLARSADNLPVLRESPLLKAAAQKKVDDMVANRYFAHTSPSGVSPWYWFQEAGYNFAIAGENLAVDFSESNDVTSAWLASPEHRANILNAGFTEIGIASARGEYDGHPTTYVVELFGTPSLAAPSAPFVPVARVNHVAPPAPAPVAPVSTTSNQTFAMVKGAEIQAAATTTAAPKERVPVVQLNKVQQAFADPRGTLDYFYFILAAIFAAALLINVFVKVQIQHQEVILGGMLVILVAGLFIVLNQHLGGAGVVIL